MKLILLAFGLLISYSAGQETSIDFCSEINLAFNEFEIMQFFEKNLDSTTVLDIECFEISIARRYWIMTSFLIDRYYYPNKVDLFPILPKIRKTIKDEEMKKFEDIVFRLAPWGESKSLQEVYPAFQWGQNINFIFMRIKFSPRLDMPGVLKVQNLLVNFDYDRLSVMALHLESDVPTLYVLNITLNMHTYPMHSWWKWGSMGHIELTIRKGYAVVWRNIHVDKTLIWPNQYLWWEMLNKYREELEDQYYIFQRAEQNMQDKEDKINKDEEKKVKEKKYLKQREKNIADNGQTEIRNKKHCWDIREPKKCIVPNPFDWSTWFQLIYVYIFKHKAK